MMKRVASISVAVRRTLPAARWSAPTMSRSGGLGPAPPGPPLHALRPRQEVAPGRREHVPVRRAIEEARLHLVFESREPPAHRGGVDAEQPGGAREGAPAGDRA